MFSVSLILTVVISKSQEKKKELVKLWKGDLHAAPNTSEATLSIWQSASSKLFCSGRTMFEISNII